MWLVDLSLQRVRKILNQVQHDNNRVAGNLTRGVGAMGRFCRSGYGLGEFGWGYAHYGCEAGVGGFALIGVYSGGESLIAF